MKKYDHQKIEKKWQKIWKERKTYNVKENSKQKKSYVLDMFPYPSGEGLHVGHPKGYIATDVYSRFKKAQGLTVLHPMGWDAFGLPAENYAIKNKIHPKIAVEKNIKRYKDQLSHIGLSYDWDREVNTTDPAYYKWTQWIFLEMFKSGLAFQSYEPINWCPQCQTGLANEDLDNGRCERCDSVVEKKPMRQWVLRITDYAEKLLDGLNGLNWPSSIIESQRNWIGKSTGAHISFTLQKKFNYVIIHGAKTTPKGQFIPWLKKELEKQGHTVTVPALPDAFNPHPDVQAHYVLEHTEFNENTIIIAHSLGVTVALKVLEKIKKPIYKTILVDGFVTPEFRRALSKDEKKIFELDYQKIKRNAKEIISLCDSVGNRIPSLETTRLNDLVGGRLIEVRPEKEHFCGTKETSILEHALEKLTVFTTRPDTLYGATYLVIAPEHTLVQKTKDFNVNKKEIEDYLQKTKKKAEIERTAEGKEKSGVELKGVSVIHPATGNTIPIWIADYVLPQYGTGAIMAVPSHDERDYDFAVKYNLPIKEVVIPSVFDITNPPQKGKEYTKRNIILGIVWDEKNDRYLCLKWKEQPWTTFITGGIEDGEDALLSAQREIAEETGYTDLELIRPLGRTESFFFATHKNVNRQVLCHSFLFKLKSNSKQKRDAFESSQYDTVWLTREEIEKTKIQHAEFPILWNKVKSGKNIYQGEGILVDSGEFSHKKTESARELIAKKFGRISTQYKLRDWVFSRQRYWGEPIPVIHCDACGVVPVPLKDLPVTLPNVKYYEPTGTGESPLAHISSFVNTTCPQCKGKAKRETNTMPQWAGSCWYYLRYMDPHNSKSFVSLQKEKYWSPVDLYVGGAEHATRHLIYARFWHKFLFDKGYVSTQEPFMRLHHVGLVLAQDGRKMSKRYGNVINPDDIVKTFGADTLRLYEMFMGPFSQNISWNEDSIIGPRRFLEKIWRLQDKVSTKKVTYEHNTYKLLQKTIEKVGIAIEEFSFNTAVSSLMILVSEMEKEGAIAKKDYEKLLIIISPFAPHITEELWNILGNKGSVYGQKWPVFEVITDEQFTVAIQVNGKMRATIETRDTDEQKIIEDARKNSVIQKWIQGKNIKKIIYVKGRVLNIIIEN